MDEAGHILNAMQYANLFHHFHPWKLEWLRQFLSINPFYPPAVYIYDGALKLIFGNHRAVDIACHLSYLTLLLAATFGITYKTARSTAAAVVATILLFLYPQIQHLSHAYMLDLPLTAMVAAGLFSLLWWKENPTIKRTFITGCVLALACFTKQLGAAYLVPPCVFLLVTGNWRERQGLILIGVITSAVMLPWFLVNLAWIKSYAAENNAVMQGSQLPVFRVFIDYIVGLAHSMSYPLTAAFALAVVLGRKSFNKNVALLAVTALGGLALTSLLSCTFALDRYAAPALITCAAITALGIAKRAMITDMVLLIGVSQVLCFSFGLNLPIPVSLREFRGVSIRSSAPHNDVGYMQEEVLGAIATADPGAAVWLNILPSDGIYNPHSFELLAAEHGYAMKPTTSRRWTIMGDTVEFKPESALWFQYYLLKTGVQGNQFRDQSSAKNEKTLEAFVRQSGHFKMLKSWTLPDKSDLSLWRQQ